MALDDKIKHASIELRRAVSGREREAIGQVRGRVRAQRFFAFAGGTLVVLATVGVAALAGGNGGSVDLLPVGEGTTNTVATTTTIAPSTTMAEPSTTTTRQPVPTSTTTIFEGDGLSDLAGLPQGWLEGIGEAGQILLAEQGLGIAAVPASGDQSEEVWDLFVVEGRRFDAALDFGIDYEPGRTTELLIRFLVDENDATIIAYGVAPLGTLSVDLHVKPSEFPLSISFGNFWQRPEVGVAVFVGQFDGSILVDLAPVEFELRLTTSDELGPEHERLFGTFGFQGGLVRDGYDGPFTAEMFVLPMELIIGTVDVDAFPEVVTCDAPPDVEPPPNQGGAIVDGVVVTTPLAAFEHIIHEGQLSDSWFPHNGYIELHDVHGNIAFAKPFDGSTSVEPGVVILVEVAEIDNGWTVTRWEGSGC